MVTMHPTTIAEALGLLAAGAAPVAGGTDWMLSPVTTESFFFLDRIQSLCAVRAVPEGVWIGAGCTYAMLLENPITPAVLKDAMRTIAAPAIRNMGTIGGNLCNASPAGDTLPVLYGLGAMLELQSVRGTRTLPVSAFIAGVRKTVRTPDELLVRIFLPSFEGAHRFEKVGARRAQAVSKCSMAGFFSESHGHVKDLRVAFGAVGPTVIRSRALESMLIGQPISRAKALVPSVACAYARLLSPIDDQRSTAAYRKAVCLNLLGSFLEDCLS